MGILVEKAMQDGSVVYTGPLGKSGPGGARVRLVQGKVSIVNGLFSDSVLMGASGFALLRAHSRDVAVD